MFELIKFIIFLLWLESFYCQGPQPPQNPPPALPPPPPPQEIARVNLASGQIKGDIVNTLVGKKKYYAYEGIPYAQPPIGHLRFKAPLPATTWTGVLETDKKKPKCILHSQVHGSEDCLYLDVYSPVYSENFVNPSHPVMVWFYDGLLLEDDFRKRTFGPDYFMEESVILVIVHHRVGLFGFLSTGDAASPGNYGLKDQILALKWVKDNIRKFGGDNTKVTIFGQGGGAVSVSYLLQTELTKNLFQRAIMGSGTTLNPWAISRNPRQTAFAIGTALDIDTTNTTFLMDALRRVEINALLQIVGSADFQNKLSINPFHGRIFAPTIEPAGANAVITERSYQLLKLGKVHNVPCIVGFNAEEGITMKKLIDHLRTSLNSINMFSSKLVPLDMNLSSNVIATHVGLLIRQKYFGLLPFVRVADSALIKFINDDQFVRAINEYVRILSKYNTVYFYRFSYDGDLGRDGPIRQFKGTGNGDELGYIWEKEKIDADPSFPDLLTRKKLMLLITNFAKTGNPTPDMNPVFQNVRWTPSHFRNITYLDIGQNIQLQNSLESYNIKFWRNLYSSYGIPPFDTY